MKRHIRKYTRKYPLQQSGVCGYICGYVGFRCVSTRVYSSDGESFKTGDSRLLLEAYEVAEAAVLEKGTTRLRSRNSPRIRQDLRLIPSTPEALSVLFLL
jgi:hypothetical protein